MKNSDADTSRERKTDVSMESMPPPKRTRTEKKTEKEAEIKAETEGVKEVILHFQFFAQNNKQLHFGQLVMGR